jgi:hypothetical protein
MASLMIFLLSASVWASPLTDAKKKPDCEQCVKIEKIQDQADENPPKAARALSDMMGTMKFSSNTKTKQKEMDELLKLAAQLVDKDERYDMSQYLYDIRKEEPTAYKASLAKLTEKDQKKIEEAISKVASMMETGKEPEE